MPLSDIVRNMMKLIGLGLYTFPEAARLTGIPTGTLRRWLTGYTSGRGAKRRSQPPLWTPELHDADLEGLGFQDLLEVRFIQHFRALGISLQTIRIAARNARQIFDSSHPFTCKRFQTDGRDIFAEAITESGEAELLDLKRRQYVIQRVVQPSLRASIEYDKEQAVRWYPMVRSRSVMLDPTIAFGKPVVADVGLRTDILYDAWCSEGRNAVRVAVLYEVSTRAVQAAVRFEKHLAA